MIYFTSDLHFGHDRPFIYKPRGFDNVEAMECGLIDRWNELINDEDEVYVLGDLMLVNISHGVECWNKLRGKKNIILGNHDSAARIKIYSELPDTYILGYAMPFKYKDYHFYLSHYPALTSNCDVDDPLKTQIINLCGHTHTKDRFSDMDKGLIYHVELDAHDNKPVSIDRIIEDIKGRMEKRA